MRIGMKKVHCESLLTAINYYCNNNSSIIITIVQLRSAIFTIMTHILRVSINVD